MASENRQFNFKLSQSLFDQLEQLAKAKGVTKTELVIEGIHRVLGIKPDDSQGKRIDSELYEQLDRIEQRFQEFVDYQSGIDIKTDQRIKALEVEVEIIKSNSSTVNIVEEILRDIHQARMPNQNQNSLRVRKTQGNAGDIDANLVDELDKVQSENLVTTNTNTAPRPADHEVQLEDTTSANTVTVEDVVPGIDSELDTSTAEKSSIKPEQLVLLTPKSSEEDLPSDHKTVDSTEMLKILKAEDPQGNWDSDRLTTYRRFKGLKDKWHSFGAIQFKYARSSKKLPNSRKESHLWFVSQISKNTAI